MRNKYNAKKVKIDDFTFDSKAEARRYQELKLLLRNGEIKDLELQPKFLLTDTIRHYGTTHRKMYYIADFKYLENGRLIVEDVKGMKTDVYNAKIKMFLSKYGDKLEFREVKA